MDRPLAGQHALITGAGRGLGRAAAQRLAAGGASVTVIARTAAQVAETAALIQGAGGSAAAAVCDVTDRAGVERVVQQAEARFGPVSILINNAGLPGPFGPVGAVDPDAWWAVQAVHQRGPLLFMSAIIPGMRARQAGRIINMASQAGTFVTPGGSAYSVGKCALIRLTEHVAAENRDRGIVAFAIQPGTIVTDMTHATLNSPDARRWVPGLVEFVQAGIGADQTAPLNAFKELILALASGRYDVLSGRYLDVDWDLGALAAEARSSAPSA